MTQPQLTKGALPSLPDGTVPHERMVSGIVGVIVFLFVLTVAAIGIAAAFVSVDVTVKGVGDLEPIGVSPVRPLQSGTVQRVAVRPGDHVVAGQLLFLLDSAGAADDIVALRGKIESDRIDRIKQAAMRPLDQATAVEQERLAQAGLRRARANLLGVMVDMGRGTNVDSVLALPSSEKNIPIDVARQDVISAEVQLRLTALAKDRLLADSLAPAKDSVASRLATAELAAANRHRSQLRVLAPISGIVLTEHVEELAGKIVKEGDVVLEIAPIDAWRAKLLIAQADVHRVQAGQAVRLDIDAVEQEHLPAVDGVVESVAAEPWLPDGVAKSPSSAAPQYAMSVLVRSGAMIQAQSLFRRGYTVRANIVISREPLLRSLMERFFGFPSSGNITQKIP